jgi:hypothetical protein
MTGIRLSSRWLLATTALLAFLLIGAGLAWACTVYYGSTTIQNISRDTDGDGDGKSNEYTVYGDSRGGMDRCDGESSGSVFEAHNGQGNNSSKGPDTVRVEIDASPSSKCDGGSSMAGQDDVYVNTYDGSAYDDSTALHTDGTHDDDDVYEDKDDLGAYSDEPNGEASHERHGDCMGDGDGDSNVINKAGPISVQESTDSDPGQFDGSDSEVTANGSADEDSDGVNDVDITIDTASDNNDSDHASAVCVSEASGNDSAPQIPLEIS